MIEVEKKFSLTEQDIEKITSGAKSLGEKTFTDTYYDTPDYVLTTKDKWLRLRDNIFELKLPMNEGKGASNRKLDRYEELDTEESISKALGLNLEGNLEETLRANGYVPFATIKTTRRKYKKGEFSIDLDVMDFGYSLGEIEVMVNDESEMASALEKILSFAKECGLSTAPTRGKVIEYLSKNSPKHYKALEEAGVL